MPPPAHSCRHFPPTSPATSSPQSREVELIAHFQPQRLFFVDQITKGRQKAAPVIWSMAVTAHCSVVGNGGILA